jgi:hypothetical protein
METRIEDFFGLEVDTTVIVAFLDKGHLDNPKTKIK